MANFDAVLKQAKSLQGPQERANLVLQSIEEQLGAAGDDKAARQQFLTSLRTNRTPLAEAIAGDE